MFKKNVCYYLILLCLFSGSLYAVPPTIQDIVNEVQQAQNLVTSVKSKLTIVNDVSTATITASALLPALDSENNFVYTKPDNIIMSSYKAVGYLHTTYYESKAVKKASGEGLEVVHNSFAGC